MTALGAERKCLARLASASYPRHCGKHMFVASFSLADPKMAQNALDQAGLGRGLSGFVLVVLAFEFVERRAIGAVLRGRGHAASKFALEGMSESLRLETRPFGIHVVLVEPGDFRTQITAKRAIK